MGYGLKIRMPVVQFRSFSAAPGGVEFFRAKDALPLRDTIARELLPGDEIPLAVLDHAVDGDQFAGRDRDVDVMVDSTGPGAWLPIEPEMLGAVAEVPADLEDIRVMRLLDHGLLLSLQSRRVVIHPILHMPAVLEERPHHVLELHIIRLWALDSI